MPIYDEILSSWKEAGFIWIFKAVDEAITKVYQNIWNPFTWLRKLCEDIKAGKSQEAEVKIREDFERATLTFGKISCCLVGLRAFNKVWVSLKAMLDQYSRQGDLRSSISKISNGWYEAK